MREEDSQHLLVFLYLNRKGEALMKRSTRSSISIALSVAMLCNTMPVLAATETVVVHHAATNTTPPVSNRLSDRLVVKFKPSGLLQGMSVEQINAQLSQPLSAGTIVQLQAAASTALSELHATSNGAHVMSIAAQPDQQALNRVIAGIKSLPNVDYVEVDQIMTEMAVPNDTYYTSATNANGTYPGLWGMWPVNTSAASAPGNPSSYGADFQTAWDTSAGAGVVVAVVDTGITPNFDIVGPNGVVAAGTGSNLVSVGYDFITDCRIRGTCSAKTLTVSAYIAPSADATDLGNYITAQDIIDNNVLFPGPLPSNSTWHGTHVAGIVAAIGNNNRGVIGGAYGAKVLPVRVLGKGGGYSTDIAEGIKWAAGVHSIANPHPARVINVSLGAAMPCPTPIQDAINAAVAAGAVVVAAAGNSAVDVASYAPSNCQNVISVAAIGRDGSRASYSNFSSPSSNPAPVSVTLAAQGGDYVRTDFNLAYDAGILSTINTGATTAISPFAVPSGSAYIYKEGTSMAAPLVSAAAALMIAKNSSITPAQIKSILSSSASLTPFPSFAPGSYQGMNAMDCTVSLNCGAGILNARLAVQNTPAPPVAAGSGGGGGGCAIMPFGANPDVSLLLAMLAVAVYWLRRRVVRVRSAD